MGYYEAAIVLYFLTTVIFIFLLYLYKKNNFMLGSLGFFITMLIAIYPSGAFYLFGGKDYLVPSENTMFVFSLVLFILSITSLIGVIMEVNFVNTRSTIEYRNNDNSKIPKMLFYVFLLVTLVYLFQYRDVIPLLTITSYSGDVLTRPDVSGSVNHWNSLSTVIFFVLPGLLLYNFYDYKNKLFRNGLLFIVVILMVMGLNKNVIFLFFLFLIIYVWKYRFKKIIALGIGMLLFLLGLYAFVKSIFSGGILPYEDIYNLLYSFFRRLFVTQGALLFVRLEYLDLLQGMEGPVKQSVFFTVYNLDGGGAPTIFVGDLIIKYGVLLGMTYSTIIILLFFCISGFLSRYYLKGLRLGYSTQWVLFFTGNILAIADIEALLYRMTIVVPFYVFLSLVLLPRKMLYKSNEI
jgi:hypothetical protein